MISIEEMTTLLEQPGMREFIHKCTTAGIDPSIGLAFTREMVTETNTLAIHLQKKYHLVADCQVMITLIGPPPVPSRRDSTETEQKVSEG